MKKTTLCESVMHCEDFMSTTPAWISVFIICFTLWQLTNTVFIQMAGLYCSCDLNVLLHTDPGTVGFLLLVCISLAFLETYKNQHANSNKALYFEIIETICIWTDSYQRISYLPTCHTKIVWLAYQTYCKCTVDLLCYRSFLHTIKAICDVIYTQTSHKPEFKAAWERPCGQWL